MLNGDISNATPPIVFIDGAGFLFEYKKQKFHNKLWASFCSRLQLTEHVKSNVLVNFHAWCTVARLRSRYRVGVLVNNTTDETAVAALFGIHRLSCAIYYVKDAKAIVSLLVMHTSNFFVSNLFLETNAHIAGVTRYRDVNEALLILSEIL